MMPKLMFGESHHDSRGVIKFNNKFDATAIKRMYMIENVDIFFVRGWQGHKIEQRWFSAVDGSFKIELIEVDDWKKPSKNLHKLTFEISHECADVLHVPGGYISSIQASREDSKLLVMADYRINEIQDEYKFSSDYFENN